MSVSGITFTPRETGEHLVNVLRNGKHIANSPFKIMVGESELGNANKVKVSGKGLTEGMANEVNEFVVDTREAGEGDVLIVFVHSNGMYGGGMRWEGALVCLLEGREGGTCVLTGRKGARCGGRQQKWKLN